MHYAPRSMTRFDPSSWRKWLVPMSGIAALAVLGFGGLYALDHFFTGGAGRSSSDALGHYFLFDQDHITDAVPALGGMIAAVLGIVITVVSIVVQLSSERYTGVARMFLRDRTNLGVLNFYIVTCVGGVLVSLSVRHDFVPRATLLAMMLATTLGLVMMAPYFAYVFWFLEPANIIARIRQNAIESVRAGARAAEPEHRDEAQASVVAAMEELTDIVANSISGKDKIIASRAVDALKDFAVAYIERKSKLSHAWFSLGPPIEENPDFVAMDPESRDDLVARKTWVEWKVMRQYLGIYNEALTAMPDINYLIAIDTRYIGEAAAKAGDTELVMLVFRYMNSYLRATLNARAVRTAYNVLNQYRQLVAAMMRTGHGKVAAEAVAHMKYYGHVGYDIKLPFVTETVAYDMAALCELACELELREEGMLRETFLELDRATARSHEQALKGVRKAQAKLAAYYLARELRDKARVIFRDMEHDPPERLRAIKDELDRVDSKDFWEIIDRGRNFEYMPPPQKEAMRRFFSWFEGPESTLLPSRIDAELALIAQASFTELPAKARVARDGASSEIPVSLEALLPLPPNSHHPLTLHSRAPASDGPISGTAAAVSSEELVRSSQAGEAPGVGGAEDGAAANDAGRAEPPIERASADATGRSAATEPPPNTLRRPT